jgi:DDE superfamily endonuclease
MYTLAKEVSEVLSPFQVLFVQQRSWEKAQSMLVGAILCRGKRTVSRVLTVMGLSQSKQYGKYYRVLSRVGWSGFAGARILLGMILALISPKQAIVIGIDETLERRWGSKIWGRGIYRDAVKSSAKHQVKSSGVRWVLVIDPTGQQSPAPLFSTNLLLEADEIVELFISRWSLEVTFADAIAPREPRRALHQAEEARAHLGFQSQRQWSKAATTRTTPIILALFSLVCLIAYRLDAAIPISPHATAWYAKSDLTFADLLAAVRCSLWQSHLFSRPSLPPSLALFSDADREHLIQLLASPF